MRERNDGATRLDRRDYLRATAAAGAVGAAGCLGGGGDPTGTLATQVTDQPGDIGDFESCVVRIRGIWLQLAGEVDEDGAGDGDEDGGSTPNDGGDQGGGDGDDAIETQEQGDVNQGLGRTYYEFDEPQEADLVDLQDGNTRLIDEREVPAGTYEFLQLDVGAVEGVLESGADADVDTPGGAPLQFTERFDVRDGRRAVFVADFTPVQRGRTGRYLLQPVATGTEVRYEDADGG